MFHDQAPADLEERLTRPIDELIQDGSPGWVSDRAEDVHMSTAGLRGEVMYMQAPACMSTASSALEDQRNRDDNGQNRQNQTAAPRASAAAIGTIARELPRGTAPRFDLAPVLVHYLPGGEPAEQIHG